MKKGKYYAYSSQIKLFPIVVIFGLLAYIAMSLFSCNDNYEDRPIPVGCVRKGQVCKDEKTTTSLDENACANNGGFKEWICQ